MKRSVKFFRSNSARLALSYLAILVALSIGFSVILFEATSPQRGSGARLSTSSVVARAPQKASHGNSGSQSTPNAFLPTRPTTEATGVDTEGLDEQLRLIKRHMIGRLVVLNVAVLIGGAVLCYYLARRTLRPIEIAMEAQSRFASDASHELRTPLTIMQAEIEYVLHTMTLPKRARTAFQSNLEEIVQLEELSDSLLRLARNTEEVSVKPVWIDEVAAKAKAGVTKTAKTKAATIECTVPHTRAIADMQMLVQIIVILLDNAIKYSPRKSTVSIDGHNDGKRLYITIRDQGPGIDNVAITRIFDRFYRSEQARKQHPTGHGLGLAIAKKLTEQQHGRLTVESEVGKGSTFTIRLPAFKNISSV